MADTGARERLARFFHETYERLAPEFGYETRPESAVPWEQVPEQNRKLMEAVAGAALAAGVGVPPDADKLALIADQIALYEMSYSDPMGVDSEGVIACIANILEFGHPAGVGVPPPEDFDHERDHLDPREFRSVSAPAKERQDARWNSDEWSGCPKCGAADESHVYANLDDKDVWNLCLACGYAELFAGGSVIAERQVWTCPASEASAAEGRSPNPNPVPVGVPPDAGTHNGVPDNFWRQVPCGHPQDPLAALTADGHWVCHCGWALDPADAISSGEDEGAPGLIVPCGKCGCYPALAGVGEARPAEPQPMSLADERALRDLVRGTEAEVQRLREQLDAARRSFERIIENLDGENEDGNIFPQAAERIARAALGDVAAGAEGFSFPPDEDASAISAED